MKLFQSKYFARKQCNNILFSIFSIWLLASGLLSILYFHFNMKGLSLSINEPISNFSDKLLSIYSLASQMKTVYAYQEFVSEIVAITDMGRKVMNDELKFTPENLSHYSVLQASEIEILKREYQILGRMTEFMQHFSFYNIDFSKNFSLLHNITMKTLKPLLSQIIYSDKDHALKRKNFYFGFDENGYFIAYPCWKNGYTNPNSRPDWCDKYYLRPNQSPNYYEPRCRDWFIKTMLQDGVRFVDPYLGTEGNISINLCARTLSKDEKFKFVYCVELNTTEYDSLFYSKSGLKNFNTFLVMPGSRATIIHSDRNKTKPVNESLIEHLETSDIPEEMKLYMENSAIFNKTEGVDANYSITFGFTKNGEKYKTIVRPIIIKAKVLNREDNQTTVPRLILYQGTTVSDKNRAWMSEVLENFKEYHDLHDYYLPAGLTYLALLIISWILPKYILSKKFPIIFNNKSVVENLSLYQIKKEKKESIDKIKPNGWIKPLYDLIDYLVVNFDIRNSLLSKNDEKANLKQPDIIAFANGHYNSRIGRNLIMAEIINCLKLSDYNRALALINDNLIPLSNKANSVRNEGIVPYSFPTTLFEAEIKFNLICKELFQGKKIKEGFQEASFYNEKEKKSFEVLHDTYIKHFNNVSKPKNNDNLNFHISANLCFLCLLNGDNAKAKANLNNLSHVSLKKRIDDDQEINPLTLQDFHLYQAIYAYNLIENAPSKEEKNIHYNSCEENLKKSLVYERKAMKGKFISKYLAYIYWRMLVQKEENNENQRKLMKLNVVIKELEIKQYIGYFFMYDDTTNFE